MLFLFFTCFISQKNTQKSTEKNSADKALTPCQHYIRPYKAQFLVTYSLVIKTAGITQRI